MPRPKNLFLEESLTSAADVYAAGNPRYRKLSRLVEHLLIRELRTNLPKVRKACKAAGVEVPEEMFAK
jgi:hypothetical protein